MEDDWILLQKVKPSDFFTDEGKPLLSIAVQDYMLNEVYTPNSRIRRVEGPDNPPAKVPLSIYPAMMVHAPIAMLVSFSTYLELEFKAWFAFVRSHRSRFICCDAKVVGNGVQDLFHVIYPAMLHKTGTGEPITGNYHNFQRVLLETRTCGCTKPWCIIGLANQPTVKCLALQNCMDPVSFKNSSEIVLQQTKMAPL